MFWPSAPESSEIPHGMRTTLHFATDRVALAKWLNSLPFPLPVLAGIREPIWHAYLVLGKLLNPCNN